MQDGMGIIGYVKLATRLARAGNITDATSALQTAASLAECGFVAPFSFLICVTSATIVLQVKLSQA
jgi:hypothetical protein